MNKADIVIRPLTPDDWDKVCNVYESASLVELDESGMDRSLFKPMPEAESKETFFRINTARVACKRSKIVGFVAWRDRGEWQGSGYLSWLYVDPACHRQGIGARLLSEAWPHLGAEAWTLAKPGNNPAISLYRKFGMQIVDRPNAPEVRLALPSSRKSNPEVPNFGE